MQFPASAAIRIRTCFRIACCGRGDPVYYDILHSYMGYRTCYYRCFYCRLRVARHGRRLQALPRLSRCSDRIGAPGTHDGRDCAVWPRRKEFGFPNEEACFALQYGHGIGLAIWEKPVISRLVSFEHPVTIEPGMVFALETFWPSTDGWSAARIEEEIVVTPTGHEVITRFPRPKNYWWRARTISPSMDLCLPRERRKPRRARACST